MASISSLGIGSGLDLNGLLDKLSKAEQQRLTPYTTQQTSYNAQLTAYGTLKSSLEKFDNLSKELAKPRIRHRFCLRQCVVEQAAHRSAHLYCQHGL